MFPTTKAFHILFDFLLFFLSSMLSTSWAESTFRYLRIYYVKPVQHDERKQGEINTKTCPPECLVDSVERATEWVAGIVLSWKKLHAEVSVHETAYLNKAHDT